MTCIEIKIPKYLKKQLLDFCVENNLTVSEVVKDSLKRYLTIQQFKKLRKQTMPFAVSRGYFTDEDFFNSIS